MDATTTDASTGIFSNALELASWNRQRTGEELRRFIETRHAALPTDIDVE
jgi:hypothetical protein